MLRAMVAIIYIIFQSSAALSGPFGLEMGDTIDNLDAVDSKNPKTALNSVPNPHPLFQHYSIWHSRNIGVCRIVGISKLYENDRYGSKVQSDFDRIKSAMASKYGDGEKIAFLRSGAIWRDLDEFVMSLHQNERTYAHVWEPAKSSDGEEYGIIQLYIEGMSSNAAVMVLEYRSNEFEECNQEIESSADSAL